MHLIFLSLLVSLYVCIMYDVCLYVCMYVCITRYPRYCSAFEDIDQYFGSIGSFFDFHPTSGCYEANPPFVPYLMMRMALHMEELLKNATGALCFIVIIPAWGNKDKSDRVMHHASGPSWNK